MWTNFGEPRQQVDNLNPLGISSAGTKNHLSFYLELETNITLRTMPRSRRLQLFPSCADTTRDVLQT